MGAAIEIRQVTKTYEEGSTSATALRGVDLDARAGELLLLMGPSGSGKTTLLSIMGCILSASSGSVRVGGREATKMNAQELSRTRLEHIGFVFQGFNLFPALTAGENVELMLDLKGVRGAAAKRKAAALLEQVGLGAKYSSFPSDLSGGEKQRVAIARALAGGPQILLADEPTAALDSHTGRNVMDMMHRLAHERGCAVAIVTHDPRMVEFADRVVRIEDGLIVNHSVEDEIPAMPVTPGPTQAKSGLGWGALGADARIA